MNLVWLRKNRKEQKERSADHSTWQVSSSLSHAPDWDMLGFFSSRRLQECVILELRKVFGAGRKNSHIALTMCFFLFSLSNAASNTGRSTISEQCSKSLLSIKAKFHAIQVSNKMRPRTEGRILI